jgi:GDP-L-fucose synthase
LENTNERSLILSVDKEDEVTIEHMARLIAKEFDYENNLFFDASFSDGQYKKTADNSKLMSLYNDFDFIAHEEGIKKTVKWFTNNYETARK